jgi:hypothetical protein
LAKETRVERCGPVPGATMKDAAHLVDAIFDLVGINIRWSLASTPSVLRRYDAELIS